MGMWAGEACRGDARCVEKCRVLALGLGEGSPSVCLGLCLPAELRTTPRTYTKLFHHFHRSRSLWTLSTCPFTSWCYTCFVFSFFPVVVVPALVKNCQCFQRTTTISPLPLLQRLQAWNKFQIPKVHCDNFPQAPVEYSWFQVACNNKGFYSITMSLVPILYKKQDSGLPCALWDFPQRFRSFLRPGIAGCTTGHNAGFSALCEISRSISGVF